MVVTILVAVVLIRIVPGPGTSPPPMARTPAFPLRVFVRHPTVPIVRLADRLVVAAIEGTRAAMLPRLGSAALSRLAGRLASLTAETGATGGPQQAIDDASGDVRRRTRCDVVARTMFVPRGFTDRSAIEDRITLEGNYWDAQVTRVAEWAIAPGSAAPQFSRAIGVVFLSQCPPPR